MTHHLRDAIYQFMIDREVRIPEERKQVIDELMKEMYGKSHEDLLEHWDSGLNPVTAHSCTRCYLQSWFKHNGFAGEPMHPRVHLNLKIGGIVEQELLYYALLAGEECTHYQDKRRISIGGWTSSAYIDWIHKSKIDGKRRIVDAKTMSNFGFMKIFSWGKPLDDGFGYRGQFNQYMEEWGRAGLIDEPWETIMLSYKKDTGHLDEWIEKYDPAKIKEAHENSRIVQSFTPYRDCDCVTEHREGPCDECYGRKKFVIDTPKGELERPPRPDHCKPERKKVNKKEEWVLPVGCSYCDFKWSCWTRPNMEVKVELNDSGTPVPNYKGTKVQQRIFVEYEKDKPKFIVRRMDV